MSKSGVGLPNRVLLSRQGDIESMFLKSSSFHCYIGDLHTTFVQLSCWIYVLTSGKVKHKTLVQWQRAPHSRNEVARREGRANTWLWGSRCQQEAKPRRQHKHHWRTKEDSSQTWAGIAHTKGVKEDVSPCSPYLYRMILVPIQQVVGLERIVFKTERAPIKAKWNVDRQHSS